MDEKKNSGKTGAKTYRRTKYFFEDSFQGKYLFSYFIVACLVMVLFTLLFVYFSTDSLSISYDNNQLKMGKTPEILLDSILSIHGILIIVSGFAILYYITRFTHKTVGPLFKIGRTLDAMSKGDLTSKIVLRKHDECRELADKVNRLNSMLNIKIYEIRTISNTLHDLTESFSHAKTEDDNDPRLDSLRNINDSLRNCHSFFSLKRDLPED